MASLSPEKWESLLVSGEYSDFTIHCRDRSFHVHQNIITSASKYFRVLCTGAFKVKHSASGRKRNRVLIEGEQESKSRQVEFLEDDPGVVARVLAYMYTGRYAVPEDFLEAHSRPRVSGAGGGDVRTGERQDDFEEVTCLGTPVSETTPDSPDSKDFRPPMTRLEMHLEIYRFARKIDFRGLEELALKIFVLNAQVLVYSDSSLTTLQSIYDDVGEGETDLRMALLAVVIVLFQTGRFTQEIEALMRRYDPVAWFVAREFAGRKMNSDITVVPSGEVSVTSGDQSKCCCAVEEESPSALNDAMFDRSDPPTTITCGRCNKFLFRIGYRT